MDRVTTCLERRAVENLVNAFAFSEEELQLTVFPTIVWQRTEGWSANQLPTRHRRLFQNLADWFRPYGVQLAYLWTVENSNENGLHTHAAIHVPERLFDQFAFDFPHMVPGHCPDGGDSRAVAYANDKGKSNLEPKLFETTTQRAGTLRYMLKGIDRRAAFNAHGQRHNLADAIGIEVRKSADQGVVPGKRCGTSHSLGAVARQRAGYEEETSPDLIREILYPPANWNGRPLPVAA